jgi:plasmid stability protein
MAELVLTNVTEATISELRKRAAAHRRTAAEEAKSILSEVLTDRKSSGWTEVDAIYDSLSASRRKFGDSAELLREDRDR